MSPIRYSASKNAFFHAEWSQGNMPADVIQLTHAEHAALLAGQAEGKQLVAGPGGRPVLLDRPGPVWADVQAAELAAFRELREGYLNRLTGIGLAAQLAGDTDTLAAAVAMRRGLLDMTEAPAVVAATTLEQLQTALKSGYAALVAAVPSKLRNEFKKVGA